MPARIAPSPRRVSIRRLAMALWLGLAPTACLTSDAGGHAGGTANERDATADGGELAFPDLPEGGGELDAADVDAGDVDASDVDAADLDALEEHEAVIDPEPDASGCGDDTGHPASQASAQTVTFAITNDGDVDRFVPQIGFFCTTYDIVAGGAENGPSLPLEAGFDCGCECPFPGPPYVLSYARLAPGDTLDLTWDARQLVSYTYSFDCAQDGWPDHGCILRPGSYLTPVPAGTYRVAVPFEEADTLGEACVTDDTGASCSMPLPPFTEGPGTVAAVCPSTQAAVATFDLPDRGDVAVEVSLP
jgi:hypothetical protein